MSGRIYLEGVIPLMNPLTGGVDCGAREVIYTPGENGVREIALPEIIREAVTPFEPEAENPSGNVPAE